MLTVLPLRFGHGKGVGDPQVSRCQPVFEAFHDERVTEPGGLGAKGRGEVSALHDGSSNQGHWPLIQQQVRILYTFFEPDFKLPIAKCQLTIGTLQLAI